MTRSIRLAVLALTALGVLALAGSAFAAYTTPKLTVTQVGQKTTISVAPDQTDDATYRASHLRPGRNERDAQPGARHDARDSDGAGRRARARRRVAAAHGRDQGGGTGRSRSGLTATACIQAETPAATWVMMLQAAGTDAQRADVRARRRRAPRPRSARRRSSSACRRRTCPPTRAAPRSARSCSTPSSRSTASSARPAAGAWVAIWTPLHATRGPGQRCGVRRPRRRRSRPAPSRPGRRSPGSCGRS